MGSDSDRLVHELADVAGATIIPEILGALPSSSYTLSNMLHDHTNNAAAIRAYALLMKDGRIVFEDSLWQEVKP